MQALNLTSRLPATCNRQLYSGGYNIVAQTASTARTVSTAATRRGAAVPDFADAAEDRILRPRRSLFGRHNDVEYSKDDDGNGPSTSGRGRSRGRVYDKEEQEEVQAYRGRDAVPDRRREASRPTRGEDLSGRDTTSSGNRSGEDEGHSSRASGRSGGVIESDRRGADDRTSARRIGADEGAAGYSPLRRERRPLFDEHDSYDRAAGRDGRRSRRANVNDDDNGRRPAEGDDRRRSHRDDGEGHGEGNSSRRGAEGRERSGRGRDGEGGRHRPLRSNSESATLRSRRPRDEVKDDKSAGRRPLRSDRDSTQAAAVVVAVGDAVATEAPVAGPPRPPGSSTGNKPLPYELPLVRPYDGDKGTFFAGISWKDVGAAAETVAALKALGVRRPSHIQAQAFTAFSSRPGGGGGGEGDRPGAAGGGALVLADQAGSGKTLAYLLPVMQALRQEEEAAGQRVAQSRRPRAIVLAPTVELVQQVLRVARALSGAGLRCRTAAVTGGQRDDKARAASFRTQKEMLSAGVDLLVATPGRLQQHLAGGSLELGGCGALVVDEVDVMLGDQADFLDQITPLRSAAPPSLRFVLVTATLPQHVFAQLREVWPDLQAAFGPGLHRTAAGLVEELVDCSGGDDISEESGRKRKLEALQGLLGRHRSARTIVFCNKIDACRDVENFLTRADPKQTKYKVLPYHEAIRDDLRSEYMAEFLRPVGAGMKGEKQQQQRQGAPTASAAQPEGGRSDDTAGEGGEGEEEVPLVLVATDRTSRGIDVLYCEHVVLFDFPRDPSEYVRRVGRTARGAGGRGTVSSLVLGRQVPLAREIIERNQKGMPVHSLPV